MIISFTSCCSWMVLQHIETFLFTPDSDPNRHFLHWKSPSIPRESKKDRNHHGNGHIFSTLKMVRMKTAEILRRLTESDVQKCFELSWTVFTTLKTTTSNCTSHANKECYSISHAFFQIFFVGVCMIPRLPICAPFNTDSIIKNYHVSSFIYHRTF